jgi:hypothetical protein
MMVNFSNARQGPDMFAIDGDGFQYPLDVRIVPLKCLIVVLLTRGHLLLALGHIFENALYAIQPFASVGHIGML